MNTKRRAWIRISLLVVALFLAVRISDFEHAPIAPDEYPLPETYTAANWPLPSVLSNRTAVVSDSDTYMPDQVLVRFSDTINASARQGIIERVGAIAMRDSRGASRTVLLQFRAGVNVQAVVEYLATVADVDVAEPNYIYRANRTPNDPDLSPYWGLNNTGQAGGVADIDINAPEAWDDETGSAATVIAVIDTGIDYQHIDLADNVWINSGEIEGNGIDDDNNGWVDDIHGIDTFNGDANPIDDEGHGTHVSGTIAARGDNDIGSVGVMWRAQIVACKFLGPGGWGTTDGAVACLDYLAALSDRGVNIVASNNSWGGGEYSVLLENAIAAHRDRGILFVAAAGNSGTNTDIGAYYPSKYTLDNIISVAAVDQYGNRASFSNFGVNSVDIAAPGVGIKSTFPGNTWYSASGTSMAAPHVTGVVGLLKSRDPMMPAMDIRDHLLTTGKPLSSLQGVVASGAMLRAEMPVVDSDGDGMPDRWEQQNGLNYLDPGDATGDPDGDTLTNLEEFLAETNPNLADTDSDGLGDADEINVYGTDPTAADTDGDGLADGDEVATYGTDPLLADTDGDGLSDGDELLLHGTNPSLADTDADGLPDGWEIDNQLDPLSPNDAGADQDGDGLTDLDEYANGTNPRDTDTDDDGLTDEEEVNDYGTDPTNADGDGDGMPDGWEVRYGLDPNDPIDANLDLDSDGYPNIVEYLKGTDPTNADSTPPIWPWVTVQGNAQRTAHTSFITDVQYFAERWAFSDSHAWAGYTKILSDQRLIYLRREDFEYEIRAVSLADGSTLWSTNLATVHDVEHLNAWEDRIILPKREYGLGSNIGVYDAATGESQLNRFVDNDVYRTHIVPYDGAAYIKVDQFIIALDLITGDERWRKELIGDGATAFGVIAASDLYVVFFTGTTLYVLDRASGATVREVVENGCTLGWDPFVMLDGDNRVYTKTYDCVTAYSLSDGEQLWQVAEQLGRGAPTLDYEAMYVPTLSELVALSLADGNELWRWSARRVQDNNAVSTLKHVFVSTDQGVVAIDRDTHQEVWNHRRQGWLSITDEGSLVIGGNDGRISSVNIDGDSDGDGMLNWWERQHRLDYLDPSDASGDADGDGISNLDEYILGSSPRDTDSDGDGLLDGDEYFNIGTDPADADTDNDGLDDNEELNQYGTDPFTWDSDGDGVGDGDEIDFFGTDPLDPADGPDLAKNYRQSFENGVPPDWVEVPGATTGWSVAGDQASDGVLSLKTNPVSNNEIAAIEWTHTFKKGELSFDVLKETDYYFNYLNVYRNGELVLEITGSDSDWERYTISIPQGTHTIRFEYDSKNVSGDHEEAAWIDNVAFQVPLPFASRSDRFLVVDTNELREYEADGTLTRSPLFFPDARRLTDLVVTPQHKIAILDMEALFVYDPVTENVSRTEIPGWGIYFVSLGGPLVATDTHILSVDHSDTPGIIRFDPDGDYVDLVMPGDRYTDLSLGPDGYLYARLEAATDNVHRIDMTTWSIVGTLTLSTDTKKLHVGEDGSIYTLFGRKNIIQRYDAAGTLIGWIRAHGAFGELADLGASHDGRIYAADGNGNVIVTDADLTYFEAHDTDRIGYAYDFGVAGVRRDGPDGDGDGIPDWYELAHGLNAAGAGDAAQDPDSDGLDNLAEFNAETDPFEADTDSDSLSDGDEVQIYGSSPISNDTDGDELTDWEEVNWYQTDPSSADTDGDDLSDHFELTATNTDPLDADSDDDGMHDGYEIDVGLNPNSAIDGTFDSDADGLSNLEEYLYGTDIYTADTDEDGLTDSDETNVWFTNPLDDDSDADLIKDGWEASNGFDPLSPDDAGTDPDGDGFTNKEEFFGNSDPNDPLSVPPLTPWYTYQGDIDHTGYVPAHLDVAVFTNLWTIQPGFGPEQYLEHVAADIGEAWVSIYSAGYERHLINIDAAAGDIIWQHDFGDVNSLAPPALADGKVYVQTGGHEDAFTWSFDRETGAPLTQESFLAQWPSFLPMATYGGDVFGFAGYYGGISSFSGDSAWTNWWVRLQHYDMTTPVVDEDYVYIYGLEGLNVIDRHTGEILFAIKDEDAGQIYSPARSAPLKTPDGHILVRQQYRLVLFDIETRSILWQINDAQFSEQSAMANGRIYAVESGDVVTLDIGSGQELARWTAPEPITQRLIVSASHVLAASDGNTYAINVATGAVEWATPTGGELTLSNDGVLYISSSASQSISAVRLFGDTDLDGIPDHWEQENGLDAADSSDALVDNDDDGLSNIEEYRNRTNPHVDDTDGDGLTDGEEVDQYQSHPAKVDTDGDGLNDYDESIVWQTDPTLADSDGDDLTDFDEVTTLNTNPNSDDSDGDTFKDRHEIAIGTDPLNPVSVPARITSMTESFETGVLPAGWIQSVNAEASWTVDEGDASDGTYRLGSLPVGGREASSIDFIGYFPPAYIEFDARHYGYYVNPFWVYVDGEPLVRVSGEEWQTYSLWLDGGVHEIRFEFYRDSPRTRYEGRTYIDNIVMDADDDADGLPTTWENQYGLNPNDASDAVLDTDSDGLINLDEWTWGTSPIDADTDDDGLPDGWEASFRLDPTVDDASLDSDADGLDNTGEYNAGTNPRDSDTDNDSMRDGWEVQYGLDPLFDDSDWDPDGDGLSNAEEENYRLSPIDSDTDSDGLPDGWEVTNGTDPRNDSDHFDPDGDGLSNGREYQAGTDPQDWDTEDDDMPDGWEVNHTLDPLTNDAGLDPDNDGFTNLEEYQNGTNPMVSDTAPPPPPPPPQPPDTGGKNKGGGGGSTTPWLLVPLAGAALLRRKRRLL